jgi:fructose-1,6-bisphosphatase/inositol monophosphatase family enzyme
MLFFGEEDAPEGSKFSCVDAKLANDDDWLWIVDPIDGTRLTLSTACRSVCPRLCTSSAASVGAITTVTVTKQVYSSPSRSICER